MFLVRKMAADLSTDPSSKAFQAFKEDLAGLSETLHAIVDELSDRGLTEIDPTWIGLARGFLSANYGDRLIDNFIENSHQHWIKIHKRDKVFFIENSVSIFGSLPVIEESHIKMFSKIYTTKYLRIDKSTGEEIDPIDNRFNDKGVYREIEIDIGDPRYERAIPVLTEEMLNDIWGFFDNLIGSCILYIHFKRGPYSIKDGSFKDKNGETKPKLKRRYENKEYSEIESLIDLSKKFNVSGLMKFPLK